MPNRPDVFRPGAGLAIAPLAEFALVANLVAIPICNIIVMPAALATLMAIPGGDVAPPCRL